MIKSVTLKNFRGLEELEVPLSSVTILTGVNGVGKTSVLEGLYCLLSETRLDVSPLSRGNNLITNGVSIPTQYNYKMFWDECPLFGKKECTVRAESDSGNRWIWEYRPAKLFDLDRHITANNPIQIDSLTEFALWTWKSVINGDNIDFSRAQVLSAHQGLYLLPADAPSYSFCRYIDFTSLRSQNVKMSFQTAKRLRAALQILNPRITDVRFRDVESGLTVILDDEIEVSLGAIGNGAVNWASTLVTIFNFAESLENNGQVDYPTVILIDEIGAGLHYSVMRDIWLFFREFAAQNPNIQFVFTSHSDDCIQAFCEAFMEEDDASVVSLHRTSVGNMTIPTEYRRELFPAIKDGQWEVRG
jgi:energy-coupling factor transporter ATP-binding protein EcfA2